MNEDNMTEEKVFVVRFEMRKNKTKRIIKKYHDTFSDMKKSLKW